MKNRMAAFLIRLYPSEWRAEYGEELRCLLESGNLTLRVVGDIGLNAVREQLGSGGLWLPFGLFLFVWSSSWIFWNTLHPLSPAAYYRFSVADVCAFQLACFALGLLVSPRGEKNISKREWCGVKAASLGLAPELGVVILNVIGLLPPMIVDITGHRLPEGFGVALLHSRGPMDGVPGGTSVLIVIYCIAVLATAHVMAMGGALTGRLYTNLKIYFARTPSSQ